eukprot:scaffold171989_cov31-Tisochrysis_lutea.AAC.1
MTKRVVSALAINRPLSRPAVALCIIETSRGEGGSVEVLLLQLLKVSRLGLDVDYTSSVHRTGCSVPVITQ